VLEPNSKEPSTNPEPVPGEEEQATDPETASINSRSTGVSRGSVAEVTVKVSSHSPINSALPDVT
jgi:hypothetical protein